MMNYYKYFEIIDIIADILTALKKLMLWIDLK